MTRRFARQLAGVPYNYVMSSLRSDESRSPSRNMEESSVSVNTSDSDAENGAQLSSEPLRLGSDQGPAENVVSEEVKLEQTSTTVEEDAADRSAESPTTGDNCVWSSTKCVFCSQCLTAGDEPKLLECLHSACGSCIKSKFSEQSQSETDSTKGSLIINCAVCKIACRKSQIIDNRFLVETNDDASNESSKNEDLKCNSCTDNDTATSWCVECSEFICNKCVQAHKRLKITKEHTIKPKEEAAQDTQAGGPGGRSLLCTVHPNEQLTLFCENCDVLTCRDCQLTDHRDHKYKFTHEIASETKTFIAGMLKDVSYKRVLLDSAMKVIDDRQNLICEKKTALVKEITQMVVRLTNTINVRGKELVHRLSDVCDTKQRTLQEKKAALEQLSQLTDHCIDFVQLALDRGTDMAILFSKRHLINYLQRIKCRRADIPNPEIPVRIHLALDKVPDLVKVLSSIGAIVVDGKVYPPGPAPPAAPVTAGGQAASPPAQRSPAQPSTSPLMGPRMPPPYPQHQPHLPQRQSPHQPAPPPQPHQAVLLQQQQQQQQQQMMGRQPLPRPPGLIRQHPMQQQQQQQQRLPALGQQQVSSSTHPQATMHAAAIAAAAAAVGGGGPQLRVLQPKPVYVQTAPGVYQAVQSAYVTQTPYAQQQQQQQAHAQQQQQRLQLHQQQQQQLQYQHQHQPPQQQQQQQHSAAGRVMAANQGYQQQLAQAQAAKWHIPQQGAVAAPHAGYGAGRPPPALLPPDDSFKITLKPRQPGGGQAAEPRAAPATVTSTIPKTPSPSLGKGDDTERNLDKYCEESVNDLMATIAKLDSNGVQVLAEGRAKTGGSPHVDSSTDDGRGVKASVGGAVGSGVAPDTDKDDPNEDWCAVCMDGGELVCCDKCPKVFHQNCHIPPLSVEESDTWQCLLCMNFADVPDNALGERRDGGLSPREKKIAERLVLELYCQYEPSLHFREVVGPENSYYHSIIKSPMSLEMIKRRLVWRADDHYATVEQLIKDVRLLFRNAYLYNAEDSVVYKDAKNLEAFFDQQLEKWLPAYAYENPCDDDDELFPPNKKFRRIISD